MHKIIIHGRLTKDPEQKTYGDNKLLCSFSIASNESKDHTDFFNCTAFNKTAELICQYFTKGKEILVYGKLQIDNYEKEGEKKKAYKVIVNEFDFCGSKADNESTTQTAPQSTAPVVEEDDSDLPF